MDINISEKTGWGIMRLAGRFDVRAAAQVEEALRQAVQAYARVAVDMSDTPHVSSAGLRVLLTVQKEVARNGESLVLIGLQPQVREVFDITGLLSLFQVISGWEEMPV